jgi:TrpR-related protein YerC/YecD
MARGKVKYNQLSKEEKMKFLGDFYSMVASLGDREEVKNFLKDLLTLSETVMLSRRLQVARMLLGGDTHEQIRQKLKVGYSTIASVQRWLQAGFGGYEKILNRYDNNLRNKKYYKGKLTVKKRDVPYTFKWLRHKYPLHFLFANAILDNRK